MALSTPALRRTTPSVLARVAASKARRSPLSSVYTGRRLREAPLGIASPTYGAVVAAPSVETGAVIVNPIPARLRDLPCRRLPCTTPLLGPTSGRATAASGMEATSSGPIGDPVWAPSMGGRLISVASGLTRSSRLAVLRNPSSI